MPSLKSISGIRGTIGGSTGEGLSPLNVASCIEVFEKCSKEQNPLQNIENVIDFHADIYTIYGLAYDCPLLARQDDCPLKAIEQLPFKQKVFWIHSLSKEEKETILEHHEACSIKR